MISLSSFFFGRGAPGFMRGTLLVLASGVFSVLIATMSFAQNDEADVPAYTLPDPLAFENGERVADRKDWERRRRAELLELFSREVYGRTPMGRPRAMHWRVTANDPNALNGAAVRREVTLWFTAATDGPRLHLLMYVPKRTQASGKVPAFLGLNFYGNQSVDADPEITPSTAWMRSNEAFGIKDNRATAASRGAHSSRWSVGQVVARGYATVTAYYGDLCEDRKEGLQRDVAALAGTGDLETRPADAWGAIGIWAWGLSRALDYLEKDPDIDARRVAVHGHSRLGKAAVWAGAQDPRFAVVISNNSGCGGAALSKRIFGETVGKINTAFPFWFARNFHAYDNREDVLPVDQHQLLALVAPRPVYVASAELDSWADPLGEFLGLKGAEPVYTFLGRHSLLPAKMPEVDRPIVAGSMGYHIRTGKHDVTSYDWAQFLDFVDLHLKQGRPGNH